MAGKLKLDWIKLYLFKLVLVDLIYYHLLPFISYALFCISRLFRLAGRNDYADSILMKTHRVAVTGRMSLTGSFIQKDILRYCSAHACRTKIEYSDADEALEWIKKRTLILKAPVLMNERVCEKGVILITFTTTFPYYLNHVDCSALTKLYTIVLEPSTAGYCLPEILSWGAFEGAVIVESSEKRDYDFIADLDNNLLPVEFGASDWVDYRIFKPLGLEKVYDSIYVANYNNWKRIHVYLKAIAGILKKGIDYHPLLVCGHWGEDKDNLYQLIKYYNLEKTLTVFEGVSQAEVNTLLNKSKVNILLSLKEGSNRSIFEGFFSGTPGIVLEKNIGVNKSYINDRTGILIDEADLLDELIRFKGTWSDYDTVKWAHENISPDVTTAKLNNILKGIAVADGEQWTVDVAVKVNSPEAHLMFPDKHVGLDFDSSFIPKLCCFDQGGNNPQAR